MNANPCGLGADCLASGLAQPPPSAIASGACLNTLPYSAGRHVENLVPYPLPRQSKYPEEMGNNDQYPMG
ncbi:hypothetical protein ES703_03042 [subsurface metagenome]